MRGKSKILRKLTAALLLNVFSFNILADGLQVDPNSRYNTSLDRAQNGVPVVNISTPNGRGVSINEFLEYNVGREGQVLNNADNIGRSHLAGIINANPNLGPNQAANLILLQVNGANRSQIEGYIEALSRQKVNVILSNENGIYLNGAGTINIKNFIPTTGRVKLKDGDVIGIDVEKGRVVIGANGFDATNTDYVNVIAKAMELQGNLVGNKVDVTLGENTVDSNGAVASKNGINSVAIDASNLGSMYAGQIKIVSTDKGAGVNSNGLIYSRDTKLEITADGKINVAKIKGNGIEINGTEYAQSELASSDKGININAKNIKLNGETQAAGDINLNGNTQNNSKIYSEGNFNTRSLLNTGDINVAGNFKADDFKNILAAVNTGGNLNVKNLENSGSIQVSKSTGIDGKLNNSGNLTSIEKITVKNDILNSGNISTNGDLSSKNAVSSGIIVANNFTTSNLQNDGKIFTNADLKTKYFKNTGEITAVGKISSDSMVSSGSIRTNEALDISGDLNNDGTLQSAKDITVSSNIKNSGKIYAGGNLSGKDTVSSGKIVSKNLRVNDLKNDGEIFTNEDLQAKNVTNTGKIASAGNISTKDLKTSGSIKSNRKVTVSGKLENDGDLEAVEDIKVSGNVRNTKEIATNADFSGKNVVSKGKIISKNFESEDLDNDGKISSNENVKARNIKNTGEIQAVGSISGNDLKTSGKVRANRKITVSGELENGGDLESGKSLTVSKNIKNTGKIAVNEDISGKDTQNSGSMYSKNLKTDNLKNDGKVEVGNDLKTADIENTKDITAVGKISGGNVNNSGKILTNGTLDVKNVKNIGKIAAGSDVTSQRLENSGVLATNGNITTSDSMINSGNIEGKNLNVTGLEFTNSGKISADNIRARVNDTKNNGSISSANDIDLTTNTLTNTKEMLAVNSINSNNATISNSGKMASNGKILLNNSSITNIGEILSGEISMQNAKKFDNTGTIKGNKTILTTNQDLNLVGNLHGESLLEISGNNITNNGNTTGAGLIKISSNDFTNNKELASNTVIIDGRGNVVNNNMITGNDGKINGNSITNNDLIAFDNYLEMNAKSKVLNNKDKSIYGGNALIIKGSEILNDEGEILGGNMDLNASKITNNVGTIQSTGDIFVTSNDFQNIGRVSNLGSYEKYYETWDGIRLSESEVANEWVFSEPDFQHSSSHRSSVKRHQKNWLEEMIKKHTGNSKINSLMFSKYPDVARSKLYQRSKTTKTNTTEVPGNMLTGKIKSNADTEYGKIIASGNIIINSGNVKNRDSLISGGGLVDINATNFENSVTLGNAVQLKNGQEKLYLTYRHGSRKSSANGTYNRYLENGGIGYESGQPSIIEGAVVNVNAPNIIKNSIEAGNGKVLNNGGATGRALISSNSIGINKGTGSANGAVQVAGNTLLSKVNSGFNGNLQVNGSSNNSFDRAIQISGNNSVIQNIKKTGTIDVNPLLSSAMFTMNMSPSSKYLLETRSKYISLGQYYGSDYFTSRVGYSEIWDRSKRLGDAFYENQLLTRALNEKLGTSFLNGKSNQELIQSMMDNAADEKARLGLVVGQVLTQDQINALNEDIIWYVSKEVNGVSVLTPQIYLSSRTRESISDDTRNRIGGINGTYVKTKDFVNDGTKWGNGGVTYVEANTVRNETTTNLLSEITGDRTYINSVGNIENIGGSINGQDLVSVVSQNGDVVNKTTTREIGYNNGEFDRSRYTEVASIGEISSNGNTYIEGKNYTSTGAVTSGNTVKINASENININALKLTGEQKFGRDEDNYGSYGFVNHLKSFVNGTDGVMMTSGKDTNISGSQVASFGNVNINAQNINITNVVNSESMESKHVNSGFLSTERKAKNSYVEDNQGSQIFGNNVLLNSKKDTNVIASDVMANKDKFGNGGNILVTAGNNVNILSDTTSQSSSSMTSKSKSIGSLNIGNKGRADGMAQIIQNSSHLSANGGNIVVKSGKDTLIGASELQSTESIGLVAGGNVVVTGLDEKYGESSSKYKGGMFRGGHLYKSNSESEMNQNITNKESVLKAGKDIVVKGENVGILGSDLDAGQDINVDAKNYIFMLSTVNSEHKHRTQTHTKRRWHGGKKTTTENWTEDNEYANNVDITTNGNILLNYHGVGAPADNKGIFAQGVNFNAKGQVLGLSEGDIYIQGTKDRLNSVYTSKTKKSFAGIGYKKSSDYVNTYQERYRLGQLYGDAGITYDADGKLRVEGVDVQSSGKTFFRGKMGTQFLPGIENGHRYEEHKSSGLTASLGLSWSGLSAGVGYQKSVDRIAETTKTIVPNKMNVAGEVVLETEKGNIDFYPTTGAVGKLVFNANGNEINILDMQNERTYDRQTQKSYVGIGANLGIPVVSSLQQVWEAGRGLRHARSKEDYINGGSRLASAGAGALASYGELFTNPISSGVSLNYSNSRTSQHREESVSVGSNLYVANGVEYNGSNLHTRGLNIQNDGDTVYNLTGSIIKEAGKSTIRETSSSTGYGISLAKGLTDGKGTINPLKSSNITASVNASEYRGRSNGVYYANNQDVTKGNSHYNVAGDVKVTGVDVKTGSVSGTVGGKMTVESVQDEFTSERRGYSAGISAGIGKGFDRNNPKGYGVNLSSISAGHTRTDVEQRITRNVTEFTAGGGLLDVKGTVKQVGSLIDGNFTLNSGGYEHEDLKDIDKSRTAGINVTVYPNVSYSQRDKNGNQVYIDGQNPKKTGTAIKTGFTYGETDKTREILATVGAGVTMNQDLEGVNRDPSRQTTEFEGRELKPVNVDLLTEYWATEAGRGKLKDLIENSERTTDGIKRILTTRDENGNLNILKSVEAESAVQKFMRIGYVDTKGKTQQQVKQELEARFGSLAKKGVKVYFYGEKDVDTSKMDENTRAKLDADGFAVTKDGTVWINKEHVDSGKVIDFNTLTQHEISHILFGEDSEYQAQYVEKAYGEFLKDVQNSGYGQDSQGIIDYKMSMLNDEDKKTFNSYVFNMIQRHGELTTDLITLKRKMNECRSFGCVEDYSRRIHNAEVTLKKFSANQRAAEANYKRRRIEKKKTKTASDNTEISKLKKYENLGKRQEKSFNLEYISERTQIIKSWEQEIKNEKNPAIKKAMQKGLDKFKQSDEKHFQLSDSRLTSKRLPMVEEILKNNGITVSSTTFFDNGFVEKHGNLILYAGGNDYQKLYPEIREAELSDKVFVYYREKSIRDVYNIVASTAFRNGKVPPDWMPEHVAMLSKSEGKAPREYYNPVELYYNGTLTEKELNKYGNFAAALKAESAIKTTVKTVYAGVQAGKYYEAMEGNSTLQVNNSGNKSLWAIESDGRLAMNYMRNAGVPIDKRYQVLKSFDVNSIKVITATENTYGLRFYDNVYAYSKGRYLFPSFNNYTNRVGLALPYEWNQMTKLKQWQIEPGTIIITGKAAPQLQFGNQYTGGAEQWYIMDLNSLK